MPIDQSQVSAIEKLNNFLQQSLIYSKDETLPDINLNNSEVNFNNIRLQLDDSLENYIIEFVSIDNEGRLIKTSSVQENISIIQQPPLSSNIVNLQSLVIVRSDTIIAEGHLYRKKIENNQIIFEYLGKKDLPTLLTTQTEINNLNNEPHRKELEDNAQSSMKLLFAEDETCYLVIDSKHTKIVSADKNDTKYFKKFVANNCINNGSLNIEVNASGKILSVYTIDNKTFNKQVIKIDDTLKRIFERVINRASSLYSQNNVTSSKNNLTSTNFFPTNEINSAQRLSNSAAQVANTSPSIL